MKFRSNSASETFIEMQYLCSIYGPNLVGLALLRNTAKSRGKCKVTQLWNMTCSFIQNHVLLGQGHLWP